MTGQAVWGAQKARQSRACPPGAVAQVDRTCTCCTTLLWAGGLVAAVHGECYVFGWWGRLDSAHEGASGALEEGGGDGAGSGIRVGAHSLAK
jgi:hypothetical protein